MRERLGYSQAEFATQLGCSRNTVSRYEIGALMPSRSMALLMLTMAEGDEREPLLDTAGVKEAALKGLTDDALREASQKLAIVEQRGLIGRVGLTTPEELEYAALRLRKSTVPVEPALIEILDAWEEYGHLRGSRAIFRNALTYIRVELANLNAKMSKQRGGKKEK